MRPRPALSAGRRPAQHAQPRNPLRARPRRHDDTGLLVNHRFANAADIGHYYRQPSGIASKDRDRDALAAGGNDKGIGMREGGAYVVAKAKEADLGGDAKRTRALLHGDAFGAIVDDIELHPQVLSQLGTASSNSVCLYRRQATDCDDAKDITAQRTARRSRQRQHLDTVVDGFISRRQYVPADLLLDRIRPWHGHIDTAQDSRFQRAALDASQ